ncbi:hypothetical protein [Bacillus badius]|uniref:hypothetical protein n=1 Tax=Bacillus badius TaxID=1455 RepID=UPI000597053F|nr:hypothetical protein [Bacillus badius]MED4718266.1 hypothetical protein [Bacillus badius]
MCNLHSENENVVNDLGYAWMIQPCPNLTEEEIEVRKLESMKKMKDIRLKIVQLRRAAALKEVI